MKTLDVFRWIGRLEGLSFLLLLGIAMPLKYLWGYPQMVSVVGMAHGILFIVYLLFANFMASQLNWSKKTWLLAYVAAVLPFGTFLFERRYVDGCAALTRSPRIEV